MHNICHCYCLQHTISCCHQSAISLQYDQDARSYFCIQLLLESFTVYTRKNVAGDLIASKTAAIVIYGLLETPEQFTG